MKESEFQSKLIAEIKHRFPEAMVLKTDPCYKQGMPDLLILSRNRWAALEVKRDGDASHRPNQDYYVEKLNDLSFAAFIFPENKEEVLNDMERSFKS